MKIISVLVAVSLSVLAGCTGQVTASTSAAPDAPSAAVAPATSSYAVTLTLDPSALQTCETDNGGKLSDTWTVTGSSVQSLVVGSFSLVADHAVVVTPSQGEDPTQRVSKDVFATFDQDEVFGTMTLSVLNGGNTSDPQCSNTYVISGKQQ